MNLGPDGYLSASRVKSTTNIRLHDEDIRSKSKHDYLECCKLRKSLSLPCKDCKYYQTNYCKEK